MFELVKLDEFFASILCCPLCKGMLRVGQGNCYCQDCDTHYAAIGESYEFRIRYPTYCLSTQLDKFEKIQAIYESFASNIRSEDPLSSYSEGLNSVKEMYEDEFDISGVVLDVGGGQGKLRHFLNLKDPANRYCCIDPFVETFKEPEIFSNAALVYPCLKDPLNFVSGIAERLPFQAKKFDYVHMRSVLDHFYDPYVAMKEAYRVLKPEGKLLVGLSVTGGNSSLDGSKISRLQKKMRDEGLWKTSRHVASKALRSILEFKKADDDHMFHWNYDDLVDMVSLTGFDIEKCYWQKPPYEHCVYLLLQKADAQ